MSQENEATYRMRITRKVKSRSSCYNVTFHRAHPISYQLHPDHPNGLFIQLKFASPNRYSRVPDHVFENEQQLDKFLSTYT